MVKQFHWLRNYCGLLLCLSWAGNSLALTQSHWKQEEFVLGTFWDPPYDYHAKSLENDAASFQLAKDAYFNLLTGTQGAGSIDRTFEGVKWALTVAQHVGLKYLVSDDRIYQGYAHRFDQSVAGSIIEQYKLLPAGIRAAIYGYNLSDEPHNKPEHVKNISAWKWFLEAAEPEKLVYVNLAPSYGADQQWGGFKNGNKNRKLDEVEKHDYEMYLTNYVDNLLPAVISFDHYPFFKDGTVRQDYFYNLKIIRERAGANPFWAYPMTVDHFSYIDPQEGHLRFMYFCPIAYGAKGLIVFTFWPPPYEGYRSALFDQQGRKTPKYRMVKRLNLYVSRIIGPVVVQLQHVGVYHASNYPNNQQYLEDSGVTNSEVLASIGDRKMMVGVFMDGSDTYLFVVNKDQAPVWEGEIVLRGNISKVFFAPRVIGFDESSSLSYHETTTAVNRTKTESTFHIPELVGGEGRLIRLGI